ncbi:MAG: hypothetical protein J6Y78_04685 [Paludibacteraceae bacterium]|nr:hypothetical protein [Paludibacteraceae bacterium]
MSVFYDHMNQFRGFYKTYWATREYFYYNHRISPAHKPFPRFVGRHKRSGATYGCSLKQFDVERQRVFHKFRGRKSVPYGFQMVTIVWGFGKGGCKQLGFNTKFQY